MPTESELRDLLHDGSGPNRQLDAARIIRRARARRLPKQLAAGAGGVLAVAALAIPVAMGGSFGGLSPAADGGSAGGDSAVMMDEPDEGALESATRGTAAGLVCGGAPASYAAHPDGLQLTITNPYGAGAPSTQIDLELRNEGESDVAGTMPATVAVALVRDGVIVALNEVDAAERVDVELAPRETMLLRAELPLTACDSGDGGASRPVPAGEYRVVAVAGFETAEGASGPVVAWPWRFEVGAF